MPSVMLDLRFALRALRKGWWVTLVALVSLVVAFVMWYGLSAERRESVSVRGVQAAPNCMAVNQSPCSPLLVNAAFEV